MLEMRDVAQPVAPEMLAAHRIRQTLAREHLGMHAHDEHLLVMAAVEDADRAARRQRAWMRQRKSCARSSGPGALNELMRMPCGLTPVSTWLIVPSFPAASIACKRPEQAPAILRDEQVVQIAEPLHAALEQRLAVGLVHEPGRAIGRIVVAQPEVRRRR